MKKDSLYTDDSFSYVWTRVTIIRSLIFVSCSTDGHDNQLVYKELIFFFLNDNEQNAFDIVVD